MPAGMVVQHGWLRPGGDMATKRVENKQPRKANSGTWPKSVTPAGGKGWGGPAKGAYERAPRAAAFEPGNEFHKIVTPEVRRAAQEDREEALALYREQMRDKTQGGLIRQAAADKLLDRVEGKAIARNLNVNLARQPSEYSDEELLALAGEGGGDEGTTGSTTRAH